MSPEYACEILLQLKPRVHDPVGESIKNALSQLDHPEITKIRAGRTVRFRLTADNIKDAKEEVEKIAKVPRYGANPVMENYTYTIKRVRSRRPSNKNPLV